MSLPVCVNGTLGRPRMTESVAEFAERARAWLADNMPRIADPNNPPYADRGEEESWQHVRQLQRRLHDGGFAGICFPTEYGGLGLDIAYQKAFDDESACYELPLILNVPTFTICCPTILDTGSEEQKRQHISAARRGDEVLVQLLSEPSGGSDLAGVITRAERRGDKWIVNGAKTWSTRGFAADYGLLLARTRNIVKTSCCGPSEVVRASRTPDQRGRAQARGLDDVPGAPGQPRHHAAPDQTGQWLHRVLRRILRRPGIERRRRGR